MILVYNSDFMIALIDAFAIPALGFFDLEPNSFLWFCRRILGWSKKGHYSSEYLNDGCFMNVQTFRQPQFKSLQFLGKIALFNQHLPHSHKCPNNKDAHLNSVRALKDIRSHYCTMLSECIW